MILVDAGELAELFNIARLKPGAYYVRMSSNAAPTRRQRSSSFDRGRGSAASRKVRVGICAKDKKAYSKPMTQILSRFDRSIFDIIIFGNDTLLNQPVEKWPLVDCLMSWYSEGFPVEKAVDYVKLRQPFCVNDLNSEHTLRDRRRFYEVLKRAGIPTPTHVVVNRDHSATKQKVIELEDAIEVDGVRINKPFVEKVRLGDSCDNNNDAYRSRQHANCSSE